MLIVLIVYVIKIMFHLATIATSAIIASNAAGLNRYEPRAKPTGSQFLCTGKFDEFGQKKRP